MLLNLLITDICNISCKIFCSKILERTHIPIKKITTESNLQSQILVTSKTTLSPSLLNKTRRGSLHKKPISGEE